MVEILPVSVCPASFALSTRSNALAGRASTTTAPEKVTVFHYPSVSACRASKSPIWRVNLTQSGIEANGKSIFLSVKTSCHSHYVAAKKKHTHTRIQTGHTRNETVILMSASRRGMFLFIGWRNVSSCAPNKHFARSICSCFLPPLHRPSSHRAELTQGFVTCLAAVLARSCTAVQQPTQRGPRSEPSRRHITMEF